MATTEFFKKLSDAEHWASNDMKQYQTEVYGLDKPGTICAFISEKNYALFNEGRGEAKEARAVVKVWR